MHSQSHTTSEVDLCYGSPCQDVHCGNRTQFHFGRPVLRHRLSMFLSFAYNLIYLLYVTRANEKSLRLVAYVHYEMGKSREEAKRLQHEATKLLRSILPNHVLETLMSRKKSTVLEVSDLHYAVALKNVAVIFARVDDFFTHYYREDYNAGESALRVLNKMICIFDAITEKYADVDKIKTINDCYMAAAGLNATKNARREAYSVPPSHSLMNCAFEMKKALQEFNEAYVVHFEFQITVGYNIGAVTAGIIGDMKPFFDIWGDTVNVASRMYSTADHNTIQVPERVKKILENHYDFMYHGKVTVKGKGEMETYICLNPKAKTQKAAEKLRVAMGTKK